MISKKEKLITTAESFGENDRRTHNSQISFIRSI